MRQEPRRWRGRWGAVTLVLASLIALDLASGRWILSWGLLGHSGEIWDGKIAVRRDPTGLPAQRWSIVRAGVPYRLSTHFDLYFMGNVRSWNFAAPLWALIAVLAGLRFCPAAVSQCTRRVRRRAGRCQRCGYDIRGLPGPRCPECGGIQITAGRMHRAALSCR